MAAFESAGSSDSAPLKLNIVDFIRIGGSPPILRTWDVHTTDTIGMLNAKIQDKLGILVRKQVIVHDHSNKQLRNCSAVADLGHATLRLVYNNSVLMEEPYNSSDDPGASSSDAENSDDGDCDGAAVTYRRPCVPEDAHPQKTLCTREIAYQK